MKLLGAQVEYIKLAEKHNIAKPITIQNPYSLLNRSYEVGLIRNFN